MSAPAPALHDLRRALAAYRPRRLDGPRHAAVACVVAGAGRTLDVLFIERAERDGDPWSGQMAFPGGRVDPGDADAFAAAVRETREEVGLDLSDAEPLGRLDDRDASPGRVGALVLAAFVWRVPRPQVLRPNHEVRSTLWVPLAALADPARRVRHGWPPEAPFGEYPGILVGEPGRHVVWGLTYQVVEHLLEIVRAGG